MIKYFITAAILSVAVLAERGSEILGGSFHPGETISALSTTAGELISFVSDCSHPLLLLALVVIAAVLVYRLLTIVLICGLILVGLYLLGQGLPMF